ncbi:MAG: hypothetical protein LBP59_08295 [Planctomycetaceae bacterium]|nr:hypothetical protein [Planctomycetaceae bacterium]
MSTTACRRDARDPSDDFLLQKIYSNNFKFRNFELKKHSLNFREWFYYFFVDKSKLK